MTSNNTNRCSLTFAPSGEKMRYLKLIIPLLVIIGIGRYGYSSYKEWDNFKEKKNSLHSEISQYISSEAPKAAKVSVIMARPYVNDIIYGRYFERIGMAKGNKGWLSSPYDRYLDIIHDIGDEELRRWAQFRRDFQGKKFEELLKKTPQKKIMRVYVNLEYFGTLKEKLDDDNLTEEDIPKIQKEFEESKQNFEKAFTELRSHEQN